MTNRRAHLISRLSALPDDLLPEVEQSIDEIENWHKGLYRLSEAERKAVCEGMAAARRGDFVPDEEMAELRSRHRP